MFSFPMTRLTGALCAAMLCLPAAGAQPGVAPEAASSWSMRAFGTGAVTWTDTNEAQFARLNQSAGASSRPRADIDSNVGVQLSYNNGPVWSATVQGLVRKGPERRAGAELSWGYLKARLGPNWSVRAGRLGLPIYMLSDSRNIGYANTAIRPPREVYSLAPAGHVDGMDLTWKAGLREVALSAQLFAGRNRTKLADFGGGAHVQLDGIVGLVLQAEQGALSVRLGYTRTRATADDLAPLNDLMDGLRMAGAGYGFPELTAQADALQVRRMPTSFTSAGASYDGEQLVLQAELARVRSGGYASSNSAWYLLGGWRVGNLLPYASFGQLETDRVAPNLVPAACPPGYPDECGPTLAQLAAGVAMATPTQEQKTVSLGLRWEMSASTALKLQLDRIRPRHGAGLFINARPGFAGPVIAGAVALDFVY